MRKIYLVKLGWKRLKPAQQVVKANEVITNLTGNPDFPTPIPTLATVQTAADELDAALLALDGSHEKTAVKNQKVERLSDLMTALVGYVQSASAGDEVKILSTGMGVRNAATRVGLLGPVDKLTAKLGQMPGAINLSWGGIKKTKLYIVSMSTDPSTDVWEMKTESSKSKVTVDGLASGRTVYFRIACVSTAGIGPWSEVISIKVY